MSAITVGGDLVHYEKLGRGRPVILIHGWVGSWRYWIPLMQHLHLKYSVYTLDLPGFGDSAKNPTKYAMPRLVETLVQFMEQLAIPKAAFIGHGLGALVITEFALLNPDRVARMLLASLPLFDPGDLAERVPVGTRLALTANLVSHEPPTIASVGRHDAPTIASVTSSSPTAEEIEATFARRPSSTFNEAPTIARPEASLIDRDKLAERARELAAIRPNPLLELLSGKTPATLLDRSFKKSEVVYDKLKSDVDKTDGRALEASAAGYEAGRMLDNLRRVPMPVCLVHGVDDPVLPVPTEDIWHYLTVDKEELLVPIPLPGVRHFPMLEHEPFPRLASDFLEIADISKLEIRERWKRRSR